MLVDNGDITGNDQVGEAGLNSRQYTNGVSVDLVMEVGKVRMQGDIGEVSNDHGEN